jgi:PKD repeat protein
VPVTPVKAPVAQPVTLTVGTPVETTNAALQVGGLTKPGIYTFSLTVEDDLGAVSKPVTITVTVPER